MTTAIHVDTETSTPLGTDVQAATGSAAAPPVLLASQPMPAKRTPLNKSDFIRSLPASTPAAEVVTKAKAAGISLSENHVHAVRAIDRARVKKKRVESTRVKKKTPTRQAPSNAGPTMSKAAFVRERAHLSPKEIVEDAKAAGIKLSVTYVYNVRGSAKGGSKTKVTKQAARTARKTPAAAPPVAARSKAEDLLKAAGAELGLARAIEILQAERARVHAVLRG